MSQYLGDISAYALAVSQGYTGTEEEYAELMASYATVGQTAVTAAQTATTKASEAATSATTATNKASEATTAATTATTKAGEASTSASTATSAKDTAVSASQTATSKATEATTAAATAVSAKDDAVSANTAAQSAKTAAQTAQTGAETAAASVQSSAAQIQTNADDISELKEDLDLILTTSENIADISTFSGTNVTVKANEIIGAANKLSAASSTHEISVTNQGRGTYTLSFDVYSEQNVSSTGYGLQVITDFSETSSGVDYCLNEWDEWHHVTKTINDRTPLRIKFSYSSGGDNVWHIKNIQLTKTSTEISFRPHKISCDYYAREILTPLPNKMLDLEQEVIYEIEIEDSATNHPYIFEAGKTYRFTNNSDGQVSVRIYNDSTYVEGSYVSKDASILYTCTTGGNIANVYLASGTVDVIIQDTGTLNYRVTENTRRIENLEGILPDYYESIIGEKISSILNNMADVGRNGETFVFVTDIHWNNNDQYSPAIIRRVLDKTTIKNVICGGDIIGEGETEPMRSDMIEVVNALQFPNRNFYAVFGNHDSNWNPAGGQREHPERYFDLDAVYAYMEKEMENYVKWFGTDDFSFWYDNESCKTRYICIDTGEDDVDYRHFTNFSKLYDVIMETPETWSVIIVAHIVTYGVFTQNIEPFLDAYNSKGTYDTYNFANAKGFVQMCIGGHTHVDSNHFTTGGIPVIVTSCDGRTTSQSETHPYEANSANNQCVDVVTVDYVGKTVKCVRIGHGVDRTINY